MSSSNTNGKTNGKTEIRKRKVKALYDFEAVEENEITLKAGDVYYVIDDSDQYWWKGCDLSGKSEGLFPSNFVTSDMSTQIETNGFSSSNSNKKVTFNEEVDVKAIGGVDEREEMIPRPRIPTFIDEAKIDESIELIKNADPTGEIQPDTYEMLQLEEECYMMGPLIDLKLQYIDQKHAVLEDLNMKLLDAFQMYNNLMKESITKASVMMESSQMNGGMMQRGMPGMTLPNAYFPGAGLANPALANPSLTNIGLGGAAGLPAGMPQYAAALPPQQAGQPTFDPAAAQAANPYMLANQFASISLAGAQSVQQGGPMLNQPPGALVNNSFIPNSGAANPGAFQQPGQQQQQAQFHQTY